MPRPLTAIAVLNAKPEAARREISDGAAPGLRLVIQPSGAKSYAFRYERPGGRAAKVTLGPAAGPGALSLADARHRVGEMRREMVGGADPADALKARRAEAIQAAEAAAEAVKAEAQREGSRVGVVLDRYLDRHVAGLKSANEVRRLFEKEVRPAWGGRLVGEIRRQDVDALGEAIISRGAKTTANRTLANVRVFLAWCAEKKIIETSPAMGMSLPAAETIRDRVLEDAELAVFMKATATLDWPWRPFFLILAFSGQRRDEVAGMRWSELDLDGEAPAWLLPAARTKNGRTHSVPLAQQAVAVLRDLPRMQGSVFVFTTTGKTSISGFSRAKVALDTAMTAAGSSPLPPWRLHDLRRSAASGMARFGVPVAVAEKVLNHVSGTLGGIVAVYQRYDFATEKRAALVQWADHLDRLQS